MAKRKDNIVLKSWLTDSSYTVNNNGQIATLTLEFKQLIQRPDALFSIFDAGGMVEPCNSSREYRRQQIRLPVYFLMLLQPSVVDIRRIVTEQPH
ncbi:hypothetical protein T09_6580 [Trichinella sp. T9]|nr:hypothetical protein T09_6580 [Trichinella sp. T9]